MEFIQRSIQDAIDLSRTPRTIRHYFSVPPPPTHFSHEGPTTSNGQCLTSVPPLLASSQHICLRGERGSPQFINPLANNERNKRISAGGFSNLVNFFINLVNFFISASGFSNLVNFFTSSPSYWFLLVPYGVVHRVVFFDATFGVHT